MDEQVQKLMAFFKRRESTLDEDEGDDNTFGDYWEFQEPSKVEFWSIELDPMTGWSHFVHKFKNSSVFLSISYNEGVKDILPEKGGIVLVHCVTTTEESYMFTFCVEYKFSLFDLSVFLRSLENSEYEALMKEIEAQVDNKEWLNKERHPFEFRAMASKVRQLLVSLDVMTASNKHMSWQMRAIELTGNVTSQGGSIGFALPTPPSVVSSGQGPSTTRSRVILPSNSKRQKPGAVPAQSKKMRVTRIGELSTMGICTLEWLTFDYFKSPCCLLAWWSSQPARMWPMHLHAL
jgi:hypothetical protein